MLKKIVFNIAAVSVLTLSAATTSLCQPGSTEGTVTQTMNSAGYTYIEVDNGMTRNWIAVPETSIQEGQRIRYEDGMEMVNFHSKSLNRTFPTIIFSSGLLVEAQQAVQEQPQQPAADSFAAAVAREQQNQVQAQPIMTGETSGGSTGAVVPFTDIMVERATGENSYTVEEIFSNAKKLDGKKVRLRGKVVKISPNIMGRNWLHLQDGTGNPMNNTHDLVVTTDATVEGNQVVVIEGILAAEKDFGAGYKYDAIVEEAQVIQ